jgi:serine phosphatase RsbU (regulator of sigma subunit)
MTILQTDMDTHAPPTDAAAPADMHVLVVDDDPVTSWMLCRWLERQGYQVASVASGEAACAQVQAHPPDIVLLDVLLPGISGLEVLERLHQHGHDLAVIMITGSDAPDTPITALRRRADDYLRKPLNFRECAAVLERAASRLHLRRQNTRLRRQLDEKRRLLEAELSRAAQVQASLLPREAPVLPGFELAARCVAAREVGGDFYDWYSPAEGMLNLSLGDVTGKGIPAALLMATVRAVMRAVGRDMAPATNIAYAQRALSADLERAEQFVTLFHAQLVPAARTLQYVDAGHGHVFLRRASGAVEHLRAGGLPLGVFANETYDEGRVVLDAGDALILYSDGLVDARPDLQLDPATLAAHLEPAASAAAMVERLVGLADHTQPLPDDLTVVVLRCTA